MNKLSSLATKRSIENSYRHNPTPPPLQSQHSNATDYSMEDFEQDGYSMDDLETSVQESSTIKSNAGNESTVAKTSRKPLSTLQNNENSDTANEYRGPSQRASLLGADLQQILVRKVYTKE